jgi:anti-sigma-28 factor FlgM
MDEDHEKVADMREKIEQGEYRVEPKAVAEAILRRLRDLAAARSEHVGPRERAWAREYGFQTECSKPESAAGPSVNTMPADPSSTVPTTVKPTVLDRLASAVSTAMRAEGGTQTQSS